MLDTEPIYWGSMQHAALELGCSIVTGDEVKRGKPTPDIFLLAAQRLTVSPEDCIVLEDSKSGARAVLAADMTVIIVPNIKQPSAELSAQIQRLHFLTRRQAVDHP
jgi:beta-phosphoglucomutase-like phosphatase (HAD superfamily)